jgi:hypothetical protein
MDRWSISHRQRTINNKRPNILFFRLFHNRYPRKIAVVSLLPARSWDASFFNGFSKILDEQYLSYFERN